MKPSERLTELFKATEREVMERLTRTQELRTDDIFQLVTEPLQRYLEEREELDQRRRAATRAIMLSRSTNHFARVREELKLAKLDCPETDYWHMWTDAIIQAAEREGLL